MASRSKGPGLQDCRDTLQSLYQQAYDCDGSPSDLRDLQDSVIEEIEEIWPDVEDRIDTGEESEDDTEEEE